MNILLNTKYFILFLICSLFTGCGVYSFSGHGIAGIETIAIEPLDNQTAEFGIREDLTDAIVNRLLTDRTLTVTDRTSADAILSGTILTVSDSPLSFTENEEVTEYEIRITVSFALRKPDQSQPIWEGRITGDGSYPYETGGVDEREEGIDKALERITLDLLNQLTSDW